MEFRTSTTIENSLLGYPGPSHSITLQKLSVPCRWILATNQALGSMHPNQAAKLYPLITHVANLFSILFQQITRQSQKHRKRSVVRSTEGSRFTTTFPSNRSIRKFIWMLVRRPS